MSITDLTICNLAIDRVSGDRIDALVEESPLGAFCQDNYPHKRDFVLGKYRWTFANQVALLSRLDKLTGMTGRPVAWLASHPPIPRRIEAIEALERRWNLPAA